MTFTNMPDTYLGLPISGDELNATTGFLPGRQAALSRRPT